MNKEYYKKCSPLYTKAIITRDPQATSLTRARFPCIILYNFFLKTFSFYMYMVNSEPLFGPKYKSGSHFFFIDYEFTLFEDAYIVIPKIVAFELLR